MLFMMLVELKPVTMAGAVSFQFANDDLHTMGSHTHNGVRSCTQWGHAHNGVRSCNNTMTAMAQHFDVHYSTVSWIMRNQEDSEQG
jgi:hypothetical protein